MNERKLFQSITQKEKVKAKKAKINFKETNTKNKSGITLIALVISIIVMLILAGVSLTATIGDNGIITQAQNATYMQSITALEEWLNQRYMDLYTNSQEDYKTRIEYLLHDENSDIFYQAPTGYRYMWNSDGKQRYFMDKSKLPEDLKKSIKGSENREYIDYLNLDDVYGITSDLKVYYKTSNTILGTEENLRVNFDKIEFEKDTTIGKLFGGEEGASIKDLVRQDKITLDGKSITVEEAKEVISKSAYLVGATKLELINLNLDNLDGIENIPKLVELYIKNTNINDYSKIGILKNLQLLSLGHTSDVELEKIFTSMSNTDYSQLKKLYIIDSDDENRKFTNTQLLDKLSLNTKESIKELYLFTSKITGILNLSYFKNLEKLDIQNDKNLTSIEGLENLNKLSSIYAKNCSALNNISVAEKENSLSYVDIENTKIENMNFLKNSTKIVNILANNSKINDISALENKEKLRNLYLINNKDLKIVDSLKSCENIRYLYLASCDNIQAESLSKIKNIINNCVDYSLPNGFALMFANNSILKLENEKVKLESFKVLKDNNAVQTLSLKGIIWIDNDGNTINTSLPEKTIEINQIITEVISTMKEVKHLQLQNLTYVNDIDFVKNLTNLKELDLRGTSVTDISILDNNCLKLSTLILDNSNIDLTKIQNCINRMYSQVKSNKFYTALNGNLMLCTMDLVRQIANCTELNNLEIAMDWYGGKIGEKVTIDITNLTSLENIKMCTGNFGFKLPKTIKEIQFQYYYTGRAYMDFKSCEYIKKFELSDSLNKDHVPLEFNKCKIEEMYITYPNFEVLDLSTADLSETKQIKIYGYGYYTPIKQIKGLNNLLNLTHLEFNGLINLSKINQIDTAPELKTIYINGNSLTDIDFLKNCNNVNSLNIKDNRIFDLIQLKNMKKLISLNLENNKIQRYSTYLDDKGISNVYDNIDILKDLNQNGMLKTLNLLKNLLTEDDIKQSEIKNLSWNSLQL